MRRGSRQQAVKAVESSGTCNQMVMRSKDIRGILDDFQIVTQMIRKVMLASKGRTCLKGKLEVTLDIFNLKSMQENQVEKLKGPQVMKALRSNW